MKKVNFAETPFTRQFKKDAAFLHRKLDRETVHCAICGHHCKLEPFEEGFEPPFGWYCKRCGAFTESDVEVDD